MEVLDVSMSQSPEASLIRRGHKILLVPMKKARKQGPQEVINKKKASLIALITGIETN